MNPIGPCVHCGRADDGRGGNTLWAYVGNQPVCHPDNPIERPDCYRLVTVWGHPLTGCLDCLRTRPGVLIHERTPEEARAYWATLEYRAATIGPLPAHDGAAHLRQFPPALWPDLRSWSINGIDEAWGLRL